MILCPIVRHRFRMHADNVYERLLRKYIPLSPLPSIHFWFSPSWKVVNVGNLRQNEMIQYNVSLFCWICCNKAWFSLCLILLKARYSIWPLLIWEAMSCRVKETLSRETKEDIRLQGGWLDAKVVVTGKREGVVKTFPCITTLAKENKSVDEH